MPNIENIRLWVKALRSGDYRQGTGALRNYVDNTFCCLGVACDVARRNGLQVIVTEQSSGNVAYDADTGYLPPSVMRWLGIESNNPELGSYTATDLNDGHCESFGEIADRVERVYLPTGRLCTRLSSSLPESGT